MTVTIVIVNYQTYQDTIDCVKSLLKSETNVDYDIFVIENCSPNDSYTQLLFLEDINNPNGTKCVHIIKANENNGYCAGNNVGIKLALEKKSDFIWILNPDTLVESGTLQTLVEFAKSHENAGLVGNKLVYYPDTDLLQALGGGYFGRNKFGALAPKPHLYYLCNSKMNLPDEVELDLLIGASMLVRREVFEKIGLMNEKFFMYSDENEFCIRAKQAGFSILATSKATVYHKEGYRKSEQKLSTHYYGTRNVLYMIKELYPKNIFFRWIMELYGTFRAFCSGIVTGDFRHFKLKILAFHDYRKKIYGRIDISSILNSFPTQKVKDGK